MGEEDVAVDLKSGDFAGCKMHRLWTRIKTKPILPKVGGKCFSCLLLLLLVLDSQVLRFHFEDQFCRLTFLVHSFVLLLQGVGCWLRCG